MHILLTDLALEDVHRQGRTVLPLSTPAPITFPYAAVLPEIKQPACWVDMQRQHAQTVLNTEQWSSVQRCHSSMGWRPLLFCSMPHRHSLRGSVCSEQTTHNSMGKSMKEGPTVCCTKHTVGRVAKHSEATQPAWSSFDSTDSAGSAQNQQA